MEIIIVVDGGVIAGAYTDDGEELTIRIVDLDMHEVGEVEIAPVEELCPTALLLLEEDDYGY